jgi:tetratricopeptide (TPR) repeat protein
VATAAALMVPVYWLIHGSVDWFWEIPALGAGAFAMLGLAAGSAPRPQRRPRTLALPWRIGLGAAGVVAALALLGPWVAERDMRAAAREWQASPDAAFRRLDRAKALNPLAERPYLYEGSISLRLGRIGPARAAYSEALERNRRDWYATLELGAIASMQGDRSTATRLLTRAAGLLPRDELTRAALRKVRSGGRVDVVKINRRLQSEARKLVDPR